MDSLNLHQLSLSAFLLNEMDTNPITIKITGETNNVDSAFPNIPVANAIYGVPIKAPIFNPASVILDARKERCGGTCF